MQHQPHMGESCDTIETLSKQMEYTRRSDNIATIIARPFMSRFFWWEQLKRTIYRTFLETEEEHVPRFSAATYEVHFTFSDINTIFFFRTNVYFFINNVLLNGFFP